LAVGLSFVVHIQLNSSYSIVDVESALSDENALIVMRICSVGFKGELVVTTNC